MASRPSSSKYVPVDSQSDEVEFSTKDIKFMGLVLGPIGGKNHSYHFPQLKETESTFDLKSLGRFRDECQLFYEVHKAVCDYFFEDIEMVNSESSSRSEEDFEECIREASEELDKISELELIPETPKAVRKKVQRGLDFDRDGEVLVTNLPVQKTVDSWRNCIKKKIKKIKYDVAYILKTFGRNREDPSEDDFNKTFHSTLAEYRVKLSSYYGQLEVLSTMLDSKEIEEFIGDKNTIWYTDFRKKDDTYTTFLCFISDRSSVGHFLIAPKEVTKLVLSLVISSHELRHDSEKIDYFWDEDAERYKRQEDVGRLPKIRARAKANFQKQHPQHWES